MFGRNDTALLFVINRKYVRPLKVLLFSLMQNNSFSSCPIEIFTDDSTVLADPFVRNIATNVVYVPSKELVVFNTINGDNINSKLKTKFAPKYTFLKFVNFLSRGYRRHVCMDADMLCVNPIDEVLLSSPFDAMAMMEVPSSKYPIRNESRDRFDLEQTMTFTRDAMIARERVLDRPINSGFMVLADRAISDEVFRSAVRIASEAAFVAEQPATTETLRRISNIKFQELPIWYNLRRRVIECLGPKFYFEYESEIRIIHYTPGKPWGVFNDRNPDFLDGIWYCWEEMSKTWVSDVAAGRIQGWIKGDVRSVSLEWNRISSADEIDSDEK